MALLIGAIEILLLLIRLVCYTAECVVSGWLRLSNAGKNWADYIENRAEYSAWKRDKEADG